MAIRMPPAWGIEKLNETFHAVGSTPPGAYWANPTVVTAPAIRRIGLADLRYALARGFDDLAAYRTDVVALCVIYPLVGLFLARFAIGADMLPLLFPLASGFALIGPFAAVGLNEMSRRRERESQVSWAAGFGVLRSPAIGRILTLGGVLVGLFLAWLVLAQVIYDNTMGPKPPVSMTQFAHDVVSTGPGWAMIVLGVGVGFLLAVLALAISAVSFPLLLDRNVSVETAVRTSVLAVTSNARTMAAWGLVVTIGLVIGSIPGLLGLIIVMPVLGHATWHLYRRLVRV